MPISITRLDEIYSTSSVSPENKGWIAVPDSKSDMLIANAGGSSGGNPGNGWKIHISIDPNKMSEAAKLITQELNSDKAPRVSIKFASKQLAHTGQPSKQVAFIFYQEELKNKEKIAAFLKRIELLLRENNIGTDPRPINSDTEAVKTKYDRALCDYQGRLTRFNYRNEDCIVMEDSLYNELGGIGNTFVQDRQIWVKQSYYLNLDDSQKHNPGTCTQDPFTSIQIDLLKSEDTDQSSNPNSFSFSQQQVIEIQTLIAKLQKEIQSSWPYPNKDRKAQKAAGLKALLEYSALIDASAAVEAVERDFPDIRKGTISTRTANLLDNLRNNKNILEI